MHEPMYDHPGVLDAIDTVEAWGVSFVDPRLEEGKAKIATESAIVTAVARATTPASLEGRHVVITAGATVESIDPVRVLTNRASGRTGRAVARACHVRGADVTLVHGALDRTDLGDVHYATLRRVESAAAMRDAVLEAAGGEREVGTDEGGHDRADAVVSAAAISDYTVDPADEKLRSGEPRTLALRPTPKLLDGVREAFPDLPMVGFKLETSGDDDAMVERARALAERVGLSFVVANDASVMGDAETRALLVPGPADAPGGRTTGTADAATEYVGGKAGLGEAVADALAARLA
jgi:phosphopantothenoylcysteine decarboxylase/phosphopantothenate--cysteine ligase